MRHPAQRVVHLARTLSLALAGLGLVLSAAAQDEPKVLNVYNWSDYIGEDTIANFEKETGIKVRYDNFDNNEILHAKLVAGRTGYDIVVPSSNWAKIQLEAGLFRKLDKSKLDNLKHMDPAVQAQLAKIDPNNEHLVNWMWGYTTVGINVDRAKAALGELPMPDNAWDLLFKPEYVSRLKNCGVSVLDSASEVIPPALHYLGKPAYSRNPADYAAAGDLLRSIRPHVTLFSSSGYINDMAQGRLCLVLGWSGDISIAKNRAIEAKNGVNIEVLIPKTGGLLFFDVMAIPADARHPDNAHKFINYIMRPQVHAELTNEVFYANPNKDSKPFVKKEVAEDPAVFLSAEDMARMVAPDSLSNELRRLTTRTFTNFKTGR